MRAKSHETIIVLVAVVACCLAGPPRPANADMSPDAAKCRRTLASSVGTYFKKALGLVVSCHSAQSRGRLPLPPDLDCNDLDSWKSGGYARGAERLARFAASAFGKGAVKCAKLAADPAELGVEACASPCGSAVPSIVDFADLADCLGCLSDRRLATLADELYGTDSYLLADRDARRCQDTIVKQVRGYGFKRLRLHAECWFNRDRQRAGWQTTDCADFNAADHPLGSKFQKAVSSLEKRVSRACTPDVMSDAEPICGDGIGGAEECGGAAADEFVVALYEAVYEAPDEPLDATPSATPTPTPSASATPIPSPSLLPSPTPAASPSPTPTAVSSTATPSPEATQTVERTAGGDACTTDADCTTGVCSADGVCCDQVCDGVCESCLATYTGTQDGVCSPIESGLDPDDECAEGAECVESTCNGAGACQEANAAPGAACGDSSETECDAPDTCDGFGNCQDNLVPLGISCGDADDECALSDSCDGLGACVDGGYVAAGTACGDDSDTACSDPDTCDGAGTCLSNDSVSGTACGDSGDECTVADSCDGAGTCTDNGFQPVGTSCGDATDDECTDADTCDGAGTCVANDEPAGAACGDGGDECTRADTCDGSGSCTDNGFEPVGTGCGDSSDTECTDPDTCDGSGTCRVNHVSSGTFCGDGGSACIAQDTCDGDGLCTDNGFAPAGTACDDDDNICTDDECDGSGVCLHENNVAPCDDGIFCNGADTCSTGTCSVHDGDPCDGEDGDADCSETCDEVADACTGNDSVGSTCDDGLFCNGAEQCDASGECVSIGVSPCPSGGAFGGDDDGDCQESCDELNNTCTAPDPDGTPCNDSLFCTGGDAGNPCAVDNDCSSGSCVDGACESPSYSIDGAPVAIAQDSCQAGVCVGGAPPCPGDALDDQGRGIGLSASCQDACDEGSDTCSAPVADPDPNDPNAVYFNCNDDDFCNGSADVCQAGTCVRSGDPCAGVLEDGDSNCSEACLDETACSGFGCFGAGSCTAPEASGSTCDDGLYCNGSNDTCDGTGSCDGSADTADWPCQGTEDGDGNCLESCDEGSDTCDAPDPIGTACDDGSFCNGTDSCNAAGNCVASNVDPCQAAGLTLDGDGDCSESCIDAGNGDSAGSPGELSFHCVADDPSGGMCDDGMFCNGTADICDGSGECNGSADPADFPCDGEDGDDNCAETCNEDLDSCTDNDSAGSSCDDGLYCTTTDTCDGAGNCGGTGDLCAAEIDVTDDDCSESCVEDGNEDSTGVEGDVSFHCVGANADGLGCTDGSYCNGSDTCASGSCIVHSGDPCETGDLTNCNDTCDEAADTCTADPSGTICSDGYYCTVGDTCDGSGTCVGGATDPCASQVGDEDDNCRESCREGAGRYVCDDFDPVGSYCSDGDYCTDGDVCDGAGSCVVGGDPCASRVGDEDDNCSESCVSGESGYSCTGPDPANSYCSDGDYCTDGDVCDGSGNCLLGDDPCASNVGDGDDNCSESCKEVTNGYSCTGPDPAGSSCSDGISCSVNDACDGSGSCTTTYEAYTELDLTSRDGISPAVAVRADGIPVIVSIDENRGMNYMVCSDTACSSIANTFTWNASTDVQEVALTTYGNLGVIAYVREYNGGKRMQVIVCETESCNSATIKTIVSQEQDIYNISVAIDGGDRPRFGYTVGSGSGQDFKVAFCDDLTCASTGETTLATNAVGKIVYGDWLYYAYLRFSSSSLVVGRCTNTTCSSNSNKTVDSGLTFSTGDRIGIWYDSDGDAIVSYSETNTGNLRKSGWLPSSATTVHSTTFGGHTSIALSSDNYPIIAYGQRTSSGTIRIADCNNDTCSSRSIVSLTSGYHPSIAIGGDGLPIMAYTDDNLKILHCKNSTCTCP